QLALPGSLAGDDELGHHGRVSRLEKVEPVAAGPTYDRERATYCDEEHDEAQRSPESSEHPGDTADQARVHAKRKPEHEVAAEPHPQDRQGLADQPYSFSQVDLGHATLLPIQNVLNVSCRSVLPRRQSGVNDFPLASPASRPTAGTRPPCPSPCRC